MGFALTPGEAPLHFSRSKNVMHVGERLAAYLTHYNETRIKKSLDWMSPVQYRRSLGLAA